MPSHVFSPPIFKKARRICFQIQVESQLVEAFCELLTVEAKYELCCLIAREAPGKVLQLSHRLSMENLQDLKTQVLRVAQAPWTEADAAGFTHFLEDEEAGISELGSFGIRGVFRYRIDGHSTGESMLLVGTSRQAEINEMEEQGLAILGELLSTGLARIAHRPSTEAEATIKAMREFTESFVLPAEVKPLLHAVVQKSTELLQARSGGMYLCDPEAEQVRCVVSYQTPEDYTGITLPYGEGASGVVAQTGKPLIIRDYRSWKHRAKVFEPEPPFHALISAPMIWKGDTLGVIHALRWAEDPPFTESDLELLSMFGNEAAVALKSAQLIESTREELHRSTLLSEINQAVLRVAESDENMQIVAELIRALTSAEDCMIALWEDDNTNISYSAHAGPGSKGKGDFQPLPGELNLVRSCMEQDRTLVVEDLETTTYSSERIKSLAMEREISSLLALPLTFGGNRFGGLVIGFHTQRSFAQAEIELCELVAKQVAHSLATVKGYEAERRRRQELELLRDASLKLTSILEPKPVLEAILTHSLELVQADDAHFFYYDGETLEFAAAAWAGEQQRQPYSEPREHGITYNVARGGETIVVTDAKDHPLFRDMPWEGAIIGIPLQVGAKVLGVMNVAYEKAHDFSEHEILLLQLFADQAAIALHNANMYEAAVTEQSHLELLYEIGRELSLSLDPQEVLQRAADITAQHLQGIVCEIFLLEPGSDRLKLQAGAGLEMADLSGLDSQLDIKVGQGFTGRIAKNLEAMVAADFQDAFQDLRAIWVDAEVRSGMGAPILSEGKLLGVITVFHSQQSAFDQQKLALLGAISRQISLALSNARRYKQIEKQLIRLSTLQQVARVVNRRFDLQTLIEETVQQVRSVFGYPLVEIFLVEGEDLVQGPILGMEREESLRIPLDKGVIGRVARTNQAILVKDIREDPDYIPVQMESVAEIAVPLHKGDVVIGVLNVESPDQESLKEEDLRMLSMVGDQVSVAIENAALYDRLRSTMEKLEQTVQERTSELQAALEQARQADQAKTAFVSDVSHELRTPLSNIRLYLDLLVYGKQERFQEYLATLNRETDRLAGLIEDLLAISRLDAGSYGTNFETVDLNSLARGLVLDRERLCAERKLKLQFSAASIPAIQADIHMISQAIASMLTNAMSYTRAGGSIQVATGLREAEGERWVILEVKDTGIGIPVEEQPRIFERFYRGSASKEMAAPGTGLGLAIAKEIIDKHGGKLTFKSAVGRGSTFTLWLPAELEDA
jgi:GAF domain-containing protein